MSEYKDVTVSLQPQDEKALLRTKTRRRRRGAGLMDPVEVTDTPSAVVAIKTDTAANALPIIAMPTPVPQPIIPIMPVLPASAPIVSTPIHNGGASVVKLQAKKVPTIPVAPSSPTTTLRIVPHKKRVTTVAAAHTLKKPKFTVPIPPVVKTDPLLKKSSPEPVRAKRTFKERRINITLRPNNQTRRMRRTLKAKIAAMPIAVVKRTLLRKGVLKPKAQEPPEEMMRNILRDYLLLHAAE